MREVNFDLAAWDDFQHRLETDRKMVRRVVRLIGEIQRDPFNGIGKPEPLKGDLSGYWSRRIDDEHRLAYRADNTDQAGQGRPISGPGARSPYRGTPYHQEVVHQLHRRPRDRDRSRGRRLA